MRRFYSVFLALMILLPVGSMAQEATPEAGANDPWVVGNALSLFPESRFEGTDGVLIVGEIPYDYGTRVGLVFRNPGNSLREVDVVVEARTPDGKLFAVAETINEGLLPIVVPPNGIAFGTATFHDVVLPNNVQLKASWSSNTDNLLQYPGANIKITSIDHLDNRIVGEIHNSANGAMLQVSLELMCFDSGGTLEGDQSDYAAHNGLQASDSAVFQIDIDEDYSCASYLLVAEGLPKR